MMNLPFKTLVNHTSLLITSFFATLFAVCFLSLSSNALAQTPPAAKLEKAEMPTPADFNVGDTWEWRQIDDHTKLEEGKRSRTVIINTDGVKKFKSQSGATDQISNAFLGDSSGKKPWRVWPLEVGKTWDVDIDWTNAYGLTGNTKQTAKVIAYEEVTVPAGKFMAFKIEHRGFFQNSRGGNGRQNDTSWYAPSVKADIIHTHDDPSNMYTRELISYKPGTP